MSHAGHVAEMLDQVLALSSLCLPIRRAGGSFFFAPVSFGKLQPLRGRTQAAFHVSVLQTFLARTPGIQFPGGVDLLGLCRNPIHLQ